MGEFTELNTELQLLYKSAEHRVVEQTYGAQRHKGSDLWRRDRWVWSSGLPSTSPYAPTGADLRAQSCIQPFRVGCAMLAAPAQDAFLSILFVQVLAAATAGRSFCESSPPPPQKGEALPPDRG